MSRRTSFFTGCLVLLFSVAVTYSVEQDPPGDALVSEFLVSPSLLQETEFVSNWQFSLPLENNEAVKAIYVTEKLLYVSSTHNFFYGLDRKNGSLKFLVPLASPKHPVFGPTFYEDSLLFMTGKKLLILDANFGRIIKNKELSYIARSASSAPVRNSENIYVAGVDNRLYAVGGEDYLQRFAATAANDSFINSIIADDDLLVFSTIAGNIVRLSPKKPKRIWQRDVGGMKASLVRDGKWLYASSTNSKVVKIDIETASNGWLMDFIAGETLTTGVMLGKKVVYQYAGKNGLYAIDKNSGKEVWRVDNGIGLLSEDDDLAYVFAKPGVLVAMDSIKKQKLYSINFANVEVFGVNSIDSNIYVSDRKGRVMSIGSRK